MSDHKISGFVLKAHPYGESHKIIILFTYELGKIKVVAHGIRKTKSKYGSTFELLNEVDLNISPNKNSDLFKIQDFHLKKSQHVIRETLEQLNFMFQLSDFLNQFTQEHHEDPEVYFLISQALITAHKHNDNVYPIFKCLEIKCLRELGYLHSIHFCSQCGIELSDSRVYFSSRSGWLFCQQCKNKNSDIEISPSSYKILLRLYDFDIDKSPRLKLTEHNKMEINLALEKLIYSLIGKKLKSIEKI